MCLAVLQSDSFLLYCSRCYLDCEWLLSGSDQVVLTCRMQSSAESSTISLETSTWTLRCTSPLYIGIEAVVRLYAFDFLHALLPRSEMIAR